MRIFLSFCISFLFGVAPMVEMINLSKGVFETLFSIIVGLVLTAFFFSIAWDIGGEM